jgi:hypothetical protein
LGCRRWTAKLEPDAPLLPPAVASPDSVSLEIFFARFPFGAEEPNGLLWTEVDEQAIPAALRRQLARNGFRAGQIGGTPPASLARLLKLEDHQDPQSEWLEPADVEIEPTARKRLLQLRSGRHAEIAASGIYDQLPLLVHREGQLCGKTFAKAQCIFATTARLQNDGRVELELVPQLHHGSAIPQYSSADGILRVHNARPKEVFDELGVRVVLSPGQMLVMGSLKQRRGSMGHQFFTGQSAHGLEQKLLVIRVLQAPSGNLFAGNQELPPLD